jgi:spore maturation protein CgeB
MLHERSDEVLEFFQEGKEIECFATVKELKEKIDFYLKNEELRIRIAEAGYRRCVQSGYLYADRAKRLLEVYHQLRGLHEH